MENKLKKIREEREKKYGKDPVPGFQNLGRIWRALLEDHFQIDFKKDIPPHLVSLMMAGLKLSRAARPWEPDLDNYDDAQIYMDLARQMISVVSCLPVSEISEEGTVKRTTKPEDFVGSVGPERWYKCVQCDVRVGLTGDAELAKCECGSTKFVAESVHICVIPEESEESPNLNICPECGDIGEDCVTRNGYMECTNIQCGQVWKVEDECTNEKISSPMPNSPDIKQDSSPDKSK